MSISVSPVSFRANPAPANVILERPGAFARQDESFAQAPAPKKKSHTFRNIVIGLAATAAALVALKKFDVIKVLDSAALENAKTMQKIGHYAATAGEKIAAYTIDPIMKLFKKTS